MRRFKAGDTMIGTQVAKLVITRVYTCICEILHVCVCARACHVHARIPNKCHLAIVRLSCSSNLLYSVTGS